VTCSGWVEGGQRAQVYFTLGLGPELLAAGQNSATLSMTSSVLSPLDPTDRPGRSATTVLTVRDMPTLVVAVGAPADGAVFVLNERVIADYSCNSGAAILTCLGSVANGVAIDTASVGQKTFTVTATDSAGRRVQVTRRYSVVYASSGTCWLNDGHAILAPIDPNGGSQFIRGLPVPARFRVCDASGRSIGTPGVVADFRLVETVRGGVAQTVNQNVPSLLDPPVFRWDPVLRQWLFVIDTRSFTRLTSYSFRIFLADGSSIPFRFTIR
jgi:hypothetical protein